MLIFWISRFKGLFYETYQSIGEDFLAGHHNSPLLMDLWKKKQTYMKAKK